MKEEEKLQKLADEEKVFNCLMSCSYPGNIIRRLQEFYKKGATLTAWQLNAMAICFGENDCERLILPIVKDIDFTPSFIDQYVNVAYEGMHDFYAFFKKHKKDNPDLKYPDLNVTGIAILIKNEEWDWLYETTLKLKWGPILGFCMTGDKEYFVKTITSLCSYLYNKLYIQEKACDTFKIAHHSKELKKFIQNCSKRDLFSSKQQLSTLVLPTIKSMEFDSLFWRSIEYLETDTED